MRARRLVGLSKRRVQTFQSFSRIALIFWKGQSQKMAKWLLMHIFAFRKFTSPEAIKMCHLNHAGTYSGMVAF